MIANWGGVVGEVGGWIGGMKLLPEKELCVKNEVEGMVYQVKFLPSFDGRPTIRLGSLSIRKGQVEVYSAEGKRTAARSVLGVNVQWAAPELREKRSLMAGELNES